MKRSQAAGAFIAVVMLSALNAPARGADLVACEPQRVTGDGRYWAYRIIDGRECWYAGRPGKPKNELFWDRGNTLSARQPVDQPEARIEPPEPSSHFVAAPPEKPESTQAMPEQWRATAADQLLAFTCCWPELEEPALLPQLKPEEGQPPAWPLAIRRSSSSNAEVSDLPPQTEISSPPVTVPESGNTVTTPHQLDLREIENAKRVQQRLIDLGFLFGAADGIWGQRSRRALQEFRAANGIGGDDAWDEATQERLLRARDVKAANTSDISFTGGWGNDLAECRDSPIKITVR